MKPLSRPGVDLALREAKVTPKPLAPTTTGTSGVAKARALGLEAKVGASTLLHKKVTGGKVDPCCGTVPLSGPQAIGAAQSFTQLVDDLWSRKNDLELQPKHTIVYRMSGLEVPEASGVAPQPFFEGLKALVDRLPPHVDAGHKSLGATRADVSKGLAAAIDGTMSQSDTSKLEWGMFRFHAKSFDPTAPQSRIFLNTKPEHALDWARALVDEVLSKPKEFPGVDVVELAGPAGACRADDVMVLTSSDEGRAKVLAWIDARAKANPHALDGETLQSGIIAGAESPRPGVSWGAEPDAARYPGESFRSVRARVLFNALLDTVDAGGDKKAFEAAVKSGMKAAGLDADQPHLNGAATAASTTAVKPLDGAVVPQPGQVFQVPVDAWGQQVMVEVEVTPEIAAVLKKQKKLAFLPETGQLAQVEVDKTRDPPTTVAKASFSLTHSADQRYKIEMGEAGPALLAYDDKARAFYVPKRVKLVPSTNGRVFGVEVVGRASENSRATEPLHTLVKRFVEPQRSADEVAKAAARIEHYLAEPGVTVVSSIPLEEGVNGKAIVKLSNGAVAMWKPSNAEFPELMRPNLDPDHYARREAFAYEISKAMGHLGRVPPAVYRDLDGQPGALIALVRSSEAGVFSSELSGFMEKPESKNYQAIALLDHVLGALDRHHGNVLFTAGNCLAIDHGICLPHRHGDQGGHQFLFDKSFTLDAGQIAQLDGLLKSKAALTEAGLAVGIHPKALELMFERAETFKKQGAVSSYWREAAA